MKKIKEILEDFDNLKEFQKVKRNFQNGCSDDYINHCFERISLIPSLDLRELYKWHNGTKNLAGGQIVIFNGKAINVFSGVKIFGYATFLPIETSIECYIQKIQIYNMKYKELLPILYDDDTLSINLDIDSKNYGKIYIENNELLIVEPMPIFNSLYDMFFTIYDFFSKSIFFYEENNGEYVLEYDYEKFWKHGLKLNPDCVYWKIADDNILLLNYKYEN